MEASPVPTQIPVPPDTQPPLPGQTTSPSGETSPDNGTIPLSPEENQTGENEPPVLPDKEEAQEAIFDFEIGDAEVEFYLAGSWTLTLLASTGLLITPGGKVQGIDSFPSFADGFYFNQIPDITLSVWLMEKFFLEVTYQGEEKDNLFLAGYEGEEEELVQHVYIGNTEINLSPSPYLEIPETGNSSIGAHALFHTPSSEHELLLRYDYSASGKKIFKGNNEVQEIRYSPEEYMRGYYFKLPDNTIENVSVYLQDPLGSFQDADGRKFKKADATDVVLDTEAGTVLCLEEPEGRVLVYYEKNGSPVGTPGIGAGALVGQGIDNTIDVDGTPIDFSFTLLEHLGQDMSDKAVLLNNGTTCLLLYEQGVFSSFEIYSTYDVEDGFPEGQWMVDTSLVKKGTYTEFIEEQPILFSCDRTNNRLIVYHDDNLRDNFRNLYSFIDISPAIYGPAYASGHISEEYEILLELLFPVSEYYIAPEIIPGSVRVLRNGIEENRFIVNYESGTITFQITILPTDRLEIFYNSTSEYSDSGDILFGWKNKININDTTFFELSTGLKWNAIPGTYTEKAYSKTGSILGLTSFQTSTDKIKFSLSGAVSFTDPDTTGIFRLIGMEEFGIDIPLSEETAWPCSPPIAPDTTSFPPGQRGKLLYKDYRDYSGIFGGSTLKPIDWENIPGDQLFPYEDGKKIGPYIVAPDETSVTDEPPLVMDFEIQGGKTWIGTQIPLVRESRAIDLSHITSLSLNVNTSYLSSQDPVNIYIQIGEIGEDIDGDRLLDKELSSSSTGFLFNDTSNNVDFKIGGGPKNEGNGRKESEDIDNNSFLDPENPGRIVTLLPPELNGITQENRWQLINIFLTETEKQLLKVARFIRIIIAKNSPGDLNEVVSGKFLIDRIFLAGEIHWQKKLYGTTDKNTLRVREIPENFATNQSQGSLENIYPEVKSIFHPRGETQKVLEVTWNNINPGEGWELFYPGLPQVEGIKYEKLSFYMRHPTALSTDPSFTLSLLDHQEEGIRFRLPAQALPSWKKITINTRTKKAYYDDDELDLILTGTEIDPSRGSFTHFAITCDNLTGASTVSGGTLYIDEIHLTSPRVELGAAAALETTIDIPGKILSYKDVTILSDFYFNEKASFITRGFAPLYSQAAASNITQSLTEMSFGLFFTMIAMDLTVIGENEDFNLSGGHTITIPKDIPEIKFEDTYTMLPGEYNNFFRSDSFVLRNRENTTQLTLLTSAYTLDSVIVQNWNVSGSFFHKNLFSVTSSTSYNVSSDTYENPGDWYVPAWIGGFQYVIPLEDRLLNERTGKLLTDIQLTTTPVGSGLVGNVQLGSSNIEENKRDYASNTDLTLSFPLTIIPIKTLTLVITPGYTKSLLIQTPFTRGGDFIIDTEQWAHDLGAHTYIYLPPFVELYSPDAETEFMKIVETESTRSVTYSPTTSLTITKNSPGSHITDLFIPSSCMFSLSKNFVKNVDLYDFYTTYTITAAFNAINLFGKFGPYSFTGLYTIDEFATNLSFTIVTRDQKEEYESAIVNTVSFADSKQNQLLIENHLLFNQNDYFSINDFGSMSFIWNIIPKKHPSIPLIPDKVNEKNYYSHEESMYYSISNYNDPQLLNHISIMAGHATSLQFPPHGYIKGSIILGFDFESIEPDYSSYEAIRIAIQAGLEAYIEW